MLTPSEEREQDDMKRYTPFQYAVAEALKELGFYYSHFGTYGLNGSPNVQVHRIETIKDLMVAMRELGKVEQTWKVKRALGIIDPS